MNLEGVWVASVTLFDAEGNLLLAEMRTLLEFLAQEQVHGFVPCGTTGEASTLDFQDRREIIRLTQEVASRYKLKVMVGCGGNSTKAVLDLMTEAADSGCEAALVVTPYYNKPSPRGLRLHFETLADKGRLPLVLYNAPGRTSCALPLDVTLDLLNHPRILGIKEASGNYGQWLGLAHSLDCNAKALLAGDDDGFAPVMALGGKGIISASANVAPRFFVKLYEAFRQGSWEKAFQIQKRLYPLTRALFLETNPAPVKYALRRLRGLSEHLRLPLVPVTEATQKAIDAALSELELM